MVVLNTISIIGKEVIFLIGEGGGKQNTR